MKRVFVASVVGLMAAAGAASAADLPARPAPAPYYKAPVMAPVYNWTGFYIGLNGGGGFGRSTWDGFPSFDVSGGVVGGTIGYNYQVGQAVFGIEGDGDWSGIDGNNAGVISTKNTWLATVRGRLGYAADRIMPFITGGAAFGDIQANSPIGSASNTNTGWTLGGGLEVALSQNWTVKAEYLYVDLGNFNCGIACGAPTENVNFRTNLVRGGINYKF